MKCRPASAETSCQMKLFGQKITRVKVETNKVFNMRHYKERRFFVLSRVDKAKILSTHEGTC